MFIGYIDKIEKNKVCGWAMDDGNKEDSIDVILCVNSKIIKIERADIYRSDLLEKKIHNTGKCGFTIEIDFDLRQGDNVEIYQYISLKKSVQAKLFGISPILGTNLENFRFKLLDLKNNFYYDRFICNDPTNLVQKICKLIQERDAEEVFKLVEGILSNKQLILPHPFNNTTTYAVYNFQKDSTNYILMLDKEENYPWILVQNENFIDGLITENMCLYIFHDEIFCRISDMFQIDFTKKINWSMPIAFKMTHSRPYHCFYDQLRYIYQFKNDIPFVHNPTFFTLDGFKYTDQESITLLPVVLGGNRITYNEYFLKISSELENYIKDKYCTKSKEHYDLEIFVGITGQKRMWLEQVEGVSNIVNKLSHYFKNICLYINGVTNLEFGSLDYIKNDISLDLSVYYNILDLCNNVTIKNLIGLTYKEKFYECSNIDIFLSQSGTGTLIPNNIIKSRGVVLDNKYVINETNINTLRGQLAIIEEKYVLINDNHYLKHHCSYHAPWQIVFNKLAEILNETKNMNIEYLDVPPVEEVAKEYENNIKEKQ